jgi:methane monooxygenase PmoA-like
VEHVNRREFLSAAGGVVTTAIGARMQGSGYTLVPEPDGGTLRGPDGRVALTYLTKKPAGSNLKANSACCFHPLNTPSGERITDLAPGDHVHHRGVFLAWHSMEFRRKADFSKLGPLGPTHGFDINRGDFWGWGQFAPTDQRVITNQRLLLQRSDAKAATLEIQNDWMIAARKVLDEKTIASWRAADGANVLDLTYRLTPEGTLVLNQTPFGGFCVRARNDGQSWYADAKGRVTRPDPHYSVADLNWPAADWYAYVITLTTGKAIGCAVVDHPSNPPSTWHNPRYVWMINPCIVANKPFEVSQEQSLTLRYRVITFDGELPERLIGDLSRQFRTS